MEQEAPDFYNEEDIFGLDKPNPIVQNISEEPDSESADLDVLYTSLGQRILAFLIDTIILIIPTFIAKQMKLIRSISDSADYHKV